MATGNDTFVFAAGFGNDTISGLRCQSDRWPGPARHLTALGITAANFATNVVITDLGADTLVTIGADTILLQGVNGVGANVITQQDFHPGLNMVRANCWVDHR